MARGNVHSHPHRPAKRTGRNASADSDQREHPDTDHQLPQVWADGACCRTTCQRARLDPGAGPVRSRVERSNPRAGKRMGSIPQATSTGRRRKSLGRGCGKLSALKIAGAFPAYRRQFGSNPCPLEHADGLRGLQADFGTKFTLAGRKPPTRSRARLSDKFRLPRTDSEEHN
jgi:hypothetical protein